MRLSVQSRLLASFGLVVALMLAVGLFAVVRLGSDNRHISELGSKVVPSTRAVGDINALMNKYRKGPAPLHRGEAAGSPARR